MSQQTQTFTSADDGTDFVVPALTYLLDDVTCIGRGGNGFTGTVKPGGGGGGITRLPNIPVTPGTHITMLIPATGSAAFTIFDNGDPAALTGSYVGLPQAKGGTNAGTSTAGAGAVQLDSYAPAALGGTRKNGGAGFKPLSGNVGGGGGGAGTITANGSAATTQTGANDGDGTKSGGDGGGNNNATNGAVGVSPGGGGGGGGTGDSVTAGLGGGARIIVRWTPATGLMVTTAPVTINQNTSFTVTSAKTDGSGNTDASFTGNVTLSIATGTASAVLGGTLTVAAVAGVATWSVTLDLTGDTYTLTATPADTTIAVGTSGTIHVVSTAKFVSGVAGQPLAHAYAAGDTGPNTLNGAGTAINAGTNLLMERGPGLIRAGNGDILRWEVGREGTNDTSGSMLLLSRMTGDPESATWQATIAVHRRQAIGSLLAYSSGKNWLNSGAIVAHSSGRLHWLFTYEDYSSVPSDTAASVQAGPPVRTNDYGTSYPMLLYSDDHGYTWGGAAAGDWTPIQLTGLVKVDGTHPPSQNAMGYNNAIDAPWRTYSFSSAGICLAQAAGINSVGTMAVACNHRYQKAGNFLSGGVSTPSAAVIVGEPAFCHLVYNTDNGVTASSWKLGGGFYECSADGSATQVGSETVSTANKQTVEPHMVELINAPNQGEIYLNCRHNAKDPGERLQPTTPITSLTTAWPNAIVTTSNGSTAIPGNDVQGPIDILPNGHLILVAPDDYDHTIRAHLSAYRSIDNGVSFPTHRVLDPKDSGYSDMLPLDSSRILLIYERNTNNKAMYNDSLNYFSCYYGGQKVFSEDFVTDTSESTFRQHTYLFNENAAGKYLTIDGTNAGTNGVPAGTPILDYGRTFMVANPTYNWDSRAEGGVGSTYTATGIATDGANIGVIFGREQHTDSGQTNTGGAYDIGTGSMTIELSNYEVPAVIVNNSCILANAVSTAGTPIAIGTSGFWIGYNNTGQLAFYVGDGTVQVIATIDPSTVVGTTVQLLFSRTPTLMTITLTKGDLTTITGTIADPTIVNPIVGPNDTTLGGDLAANNTTAGHFAVVKCSCVRFTRGILTTGLLTGAEVKPTPASLKNNEVALAAGTPSLTGFQLALFTTYDGGVNGSPDKYGGFDPAYYPAVKGHVITQYRNNQLPSEMWTANGFPWWDSTTAMGAHIRLSYFSNASNSYFKLLDATSRYDIQNSTGSYNGTFTFFGFVQMVTDVAGNQWLFDNCRDIGTNPGWEAYIAHTTGNLVFKIANGTDFAPFNETFATGFVVGTPYFLSVSGSGVGSHLTVRYATLTKTAAGPMSTITSTATIGTLGNNASTLAPWIGIKQNGGSGALDGRISNLHLSTTVLTAAEILAWANIIAPISGKVHRNRATYAHPRRLARNLTGRH